MGLMTLQPLAYAVAYVTFFLGTSSIFLRGYCRIFILKTWGWDDHLAMVILVFNIAQQVVLHMFLYWGVGLHMDSLSIAQKIGILKWLLIEEVIYYTVHWVIKSAFLFFYLRLSPHEPFRTLVCVGMGLNASIWVINILLACLQCLPFDEIMHPGTHPDAVCISRLVLLVVPSVLNIIADLYILILPISIVWNLQMAVRRKIAVLSVIAFGSSSVIVACFRLIPLLELYSSSDTSWVLGKMVVVAALEIQLAIIAVNLPSLKALWTRMTNGSFSGSKETSNPTGYRLSSVERNCTVNSTSGGYANRSAKGERSKGSRGSLSQLETDIPSTESEEELFQQAGTSVQAPPSGSRGHVTAIKVTTNVDVSSSVKDDDIEPHRYTFPGC